MQQQFPSISPITLRPFAFIMHEDYLYGDISLHFSYPAQCLANLE